MSEDEKVQGAPGPPKLKTLPIVKWERQPDGDVHAALKALDETLYSLVVRATPSDNGGWGAFLVADGKMVHQSEHESRNEAQLAATDALRRAINLREGP